MVSHFLDVFCEVCVTLGVDFVVLEGPGNTLEFRCILGPPLGPQDSENMDFEGNKFHPWTPTAIPFGLIQDSYLQD